MQAILETMQFLKVQLNSYEKIIDSHTTTAAEKQLSARNLKFV